MNRRQLFQALGAALVLPHEPQVIYSFPTPKVELVAIDFETSSLSLYRGIREGMVKYSKMAVTPDPWVEMILTGYVPMFPPHPFGRVLADTCK